MLELDKKTLDGKPHLSNMSEIGGIEPTTTLLDKKGRISPISAKSATINSKTTSLRKLEGQFESMLEISLSS